MLQIIISILIFIFAVLNFKKGLIAFLAFQVVWFKDAQVINLTGLASINIDLLMDVAFLILFIFKKRKLRCTRVQFPLSVPFLIIGASWLLSCFGTQTSVLSELVRASGNICVRLLFIVMLWYVLEDHEDFVSLYKLITIIIFVACLYSLFEYATQNNNVLDYKTTLTSVPLTSYNTNEYALAHRGYRVYSLFEHPITTALLYGFYFVFTITILIAYREKIKLKQLVLITCVLCVPGIMLTKMRTGIFFVLFALFLELRDFPKRIGSKRLFKVIMIGLFGLIFVAPVVAQNADLILSMFNRSVQSTIGGSNFSWRLVQAQNIFEFGKQSFLVGFGERFRDIPSLIMIRKYTGDFESLWFEQFLAHGIIGVIGYAVLAYYTTFKLPKEYGTNYLLGFSLAYWVTYTMTSLPYFRTFLFYLIVFYFIKKTDCYKRMTRNV